MRDTNENDVVILKQGPGGHTKQATQLPVLTITEGENNDYEREHKTD